MSSSRAWCLGLALAAVAPLAASSPAFGQVAERPAESDLFGAPAAPEPAATPPKEGTPPPATPGPPPAEGSTQASPPGPVTNESRRDDAILGGDELPKSTAEVAAEDPLRIGGQLYLRAASSMQAGQTPSSWSFSSPTLFDGYLDARPNERVRAYARTRTSFDGTLPPNGSTSSAASASSSQVFPLFSSATSSPTRGPTTALDQLWMRFDLKHTVFFTVGRQHVKWGTGKIWNPTDYLHPSPRNPLDLFDARTGSTMIKMHVPYEARGWNFYGFVLTESPGTTNSLRRIGGAGRAELVFGSAELGLDVLVRDGDKPKYGADLSFGVWIIDFYGELALRYGSEIDRVRFDPTFPVSVSGATSDQFPSIVEGLFPRYRSTGRKLQAVGGANVSVKYNDNDVLMFGAEYFYNQLGYSDSNAYLGLLLPRSTPLQNQASFFYLGRNYVATYIIANAPYSWNLTNFRLTSLSNLSDNSHIVRFDYGHLLLTHMTFEAFVSGHLGPGDGELRTGSHVLAPFITREPLALDVGVALRVAL